MNPVRDTVEATVGLGDGQSIDCIVFSMSPDELNEYDLPAEIERSLKAYINVGAAI